MERGLGHPFGRKAMTKLLYRGQQYVQHKDAADAQTIELTYRRSVYASKKQQVAHTHPDLTYRGNHYQK